MDAGIIPNLVARLSCGELQVMTPALRALGNIVTGSDVQTDAVVAANALPVFANLLKHGRMNIVKEAAWTISNVTAGNTTQIQAVIDANVLAPLIDVLVRVSFYFLHADNGRHGELERTFSYSDFRVTSSLKRRRLGQ